MTSKKRHRELVQAFQLDDVATVTAILAGGADPDAVIGDSGDTLLAAAIRGERRQMVAALLAAGASIQCMNAAGETPESLGLASRSLLIRRIFLPREELPPPPPPPRPPPRVPPVERVGELEAALRANWSLEALAIHGDELQQAGDPRGELIALDLAPRPASGPWRERRRALLAAWLGADLSQRAGDITRHGFVPHLDDRAGIWQPRPNASLRAAELLDSTAGPFIRAFAVSGAPARVLAALQRLAHRARPWLTELVILTSPDEPLSDELIARLATAAPNLHTIYAIGGRIITRLPPRVARIVASVALDDPRCVHIASLAPPGLAQRDLLVLLEAIATTPDRDDLARDFASLFPHLPEHLAFLLSICALDEAGLTALGRALRVHRMALGTDGRVLERD